MKCPVCKEEWRPVPGWPYLVSSGGKVYHESGRVKKPGVLRGYHILTLHNKGSKWHTTVQRVVCMAWHGNPPYPRDEWDASHLDGNRLNNTPSNLRWETREKNMWRAKAGYTQQMECPI